MSQRPRIGLTMRLEIETRRFYLGRDYSEALEGCGALPVHLPLIPEESYINEVLDGLDGVLLPGSDSDVDPAYFGEDPHPRLKRVVPEKDLTEMLVLKKAEDADIPVLAICFGMQALNVFRGGSLIQDIDSQVENAVKHEQGAPLDRRSHRIKLEEGSLISRLAENDEVKVNSHHHQAIRTVGNNLTATAWAADGVIECVEDIRADRFALGVQWHPELDWRSGALSSRIFELFVQTCRQKVSSRGVVRV